ncbi:hypothetical protein JRQ81_006043 [Phrynocephalus forsythii]|uniref:Uncharacterized protein n=1 Tax=Phrynocephalus forsythii TaxID=171643 RepID=A0A9Q0XH00_9SAUR|nr:hypothetical protein JRQ81_006043 [Phrynocephalus forsythii]
MEAPLLGGSSQDEPPPVSAFERQVRRRKIMIYRPGAEERVSPTLWPEPENRGGTSPPPCGDVGQSPNKRQRLLQGEPPEREKNEGSPGGRAGETLWHVASPMEKKQRRVLAVDLEDFSATQVPEDLGGRSPPQGPTVPPCPNASPTATLKEESASLSATSQSSAASRSPPLHSGSRDKLAQACRQLWNPKSSPPRAGVRAPAGQEAVSAEGRLPKWRRGGPRGSFAGQAPSAHLDHPSGGRGSRPRPGCRRWQGAAGDLPTPLSE